MAAGRARKAAREAMRREFMMAGGPIDVYSRLRRTGAPSAVWQSREGFPTFRVQPASWRSRAPSAESSSPLPNDRSCKRAG